MKRKLLIMFIVGLFGSLNAQQSDPNYLGDVNAEAQKICFSKEDNYIYTYPANPNATPNAKDLDPNIDFGEDINNTHELIAPSWFYIESKTHLPFSIKITKEIINGNGVNLDFVCFKVPKGEDLTSLTTNLTGDANIVDSDYVFNDEGYTTIDFPADPNEEYNYVFVIFNMWKNYGDPVPEANIVFELIDPIPPTSLNTTPTISPQYSCIGDAITVSGSTKNPADTKYEWKIINYNNANEYYEGEGNPFTFTPNPTFATNDYERYYVNFTATYDPGFLCTPVTASLTNKLRSLYVYPKPVADFTWDDSKDYCPDQEITFTSTSDVMTKGVSSTHKVVYHWDFGDGNTSTNTVTTSNSNPVTTVHNYANEGTYTITLKVSHNNGNNEVCSDIITKQITIKAPDVDFP